MILNVIAVVLQLFEIVLLIRVLLTWFPNIDRSQAWVQMIFQITEPVLRPIRNMLPQSGMIDWSPTVVFLIIFVLLNVLTR